jgi:hypothetical protein
LQVSPAMSEPAYPHAADLVCGAACIPVRFPSQGHISSGPGGRQRAAGESPKPVHCVFLQQPAWPWRTGLSACRARPGMKHAWRLTRGHPTGNHPPARPCRRSLRPHPPGPQRGTWPDRLKRHQRAGVRNTRGCPFNTNKAQRRLPRFVRTLRSAILLLPALPLRQFSGSAPSFALAKCSLIDPPDGFPLQSLINLRRTRMKWLTDLLRSPASCLGRIGRADRITCLTYLEELPQRTCERAVKGRPASGLSLLAKPSF